MPPITTGRVMSSAAPGGATAPAASGVRVATASPGVGVAAGAGARLTGTTAALLGGTWSTRSTTRESAVLEPSEASTMKEWSPRDAVAGMVTASSVGEVTVNGTTTSPGSKRTRVVPSR